MKPAVIFLLIGLSCALVDLVSPSPGVINIGGNPADYPKYLEEPRYQVYIAYRPSVSKHLAKLLKVLLSRRGVTSYLDVDDAKNGEGVVKDSPNFVVLLSTGALDKTIGDLTYTDPLHSLIKQAVESDRNIIPIFDDFKFPDGEFSKYVKEMLRFQGVDWNHSMINGTIGRVGKYLKDSKK